MTPTLVAVAHGSRDPRSAATIAALVDEVRRQAPGLDVRLSFLDLNAPRLPDVLDSLSDAVVVPLLLGNAYHARVDVPGTVARTAQRHPQLRVAVSDVLGTDPLLVGTLLRRVRAVAPIAAADLGVVIAATGSSRPAANAEVAALARQLRRRYPWIGASAAFATAAAPSVPEALDRLRAAGARRLAVATWFLAPGLLTERVVAAARDFDPSVLITDPLGPDPAVAQVVLARYQAAATGFDTPLTAAG